MDRKSPAHSAFENPIPPSRGWLRCCKPFLSIGCLVAALLVDYLNLLCLDWSRNMDIKKLFRVLVVGGATLGLAHCGPGGTDNNGNDVNGVNNQNLGGLTTADGGVEPDAGIGTNPGGPPGW
jgi:hypothetical protein